MPTSIDSTEIMWSGMSRNGREFGALKFTTYPGGEPLVDAFQDFRTVDVDRLLLRPKTMTALLAGLFCIDAMRERGRQPPNLILPLVPGARQDRINNSGDYLFTAKSVAALINAREFRSVTVLDPHSDVVTALIDRCIPIPTNAILERLHLEDQYAAVIAPDGGAVKRAGTAARYLGVPLVHAWKRRDVTTGELSGFGIENLSRFSSGKLLIVDDICDGGRTFIGLAEQIQQQEREADLYVTHGIFSKGLGELLNSFGRIICTDSVMSSPATDAIAGGDGCPDVAYARLLNRIQKQVGERVQIIPICEQFLKGEAA